MLKIRLQGTIQDMKWFWQLLEYQKEVELLRRSEAYANKGTKKYFRMYADVERIGGYDENKESENL